VECVGVDSDVEDFDVVAWESVAHVDFLYPGGCYEYQREVGEDVAVVGDVAVGDEPGDGCYAESLGVEYEVGGVAPVADTDGDVGSEPAVVPFLFLCGFVVDGVYVDAEFLEAFVEEVALCGEAGGRGRIVIEDEYLHDAAFALFHVFSVC